MKNKNKKVCDATIRMTSRARGEVTVTIDGYYTQYSTLILICFAVDLCMELTGYSFDRVIEGVAKAREEHGGSFLGTDYPLH
jgi:hypothetical protein